MSRVIFLVFFTLSASSYASRDDDGTKGEMHVAVGPRNSMVEIREKTHSQPEEDRAKAEDSEASALAAEQAQALKDFNDASVEFASIQAQSVKLREAMKELGFNSQDSSLAQSSQKAAVKEAARSKLQQIAQQRLLLVQTADDLDKRMEEHAAVLEKAKVEQEYENAVGVIAQHDATSVQAAEVKQKIALHRFQVMDTQSSNLMQWVKDLQQLKATRDKLIVQKEEAEKAALDLGFTAEEVKEASRASKVDMEARQKQQLADVMANSAEEMAQIESAAGNIMKGLDDFAAWKNRQDHSPASLAEAEKVQENLNNALKFLEDHEGVINERTKQINALMKQANMGQL